VRHLRALRPWKVRIDKDPNNKFSDDGEQGDQDGHPLLRKGIPAPVNAELDQLPFCWSTLQWLSSLLMRLSSRGFSLIPVYSLLGLQLLHLHLVFLLQLLGLLLVLSF
jgi:hypothetical protein